jgi:N-acetyl-anhydromuramyl-L-alanine amidase AmpD
MKKIWWIIGGLTILILGIGGTMNTAKIINIVNALPKGRGTYRKRLLSKITGIVVHHSASDYGGATEIARFHTITRGWPGIGYHFVISPDGTINQTNNIDSVSYHVGNSNTPTIGICLIGNLSKHPPTAKQLESLKELIAHLKTLLKKELTVKGHRDYNPTECPGKFMKLPL